jgi:hypothetical protein
VGAGAGASGVWTVLDFFVVILGLPVGAGVGVYFGLRMYRRVRRLQTTGEFVLEPVDLKWAAAAMALVLIARAYYLLSQ